MKTFEMNGSNYKADDETFGQLRHAVHRYKYSASKDVTAITAIMGLGLKSGRIVQIQEKAQPVPTLWQDIEKLKEDGHLSW